LAQVEKNLLGGKGDFLGSDCRKGKEKKRVGGGEGQHLILDRKEEEKKPREKGQASGEGNGGNKSCFFS